MVKRPRHDSSELLHISRMLPTPQDLGKPSRRCRIRGSSDEDNPIGLIRNEDFRAGGPVLPAIPLLQLPHTQDVSTINEANDQPTSPFRLALKEILKNTTLSEYLPELRRYKSEIDTDLEPEYYLVILSREFKLPGNEWRDIAIQIHDLCQKHDFQKLNVMITDLRGLYPPILRPLPSGALYSQQWENGMCLKLLDVLREAFEFSAMLLILRGIPPSDLVGGWEGSPGTEFLPTILIFVEPDCQADWKEAASRIENCINSDPAFNEVEVEVVRRKSW